MLTAPFPYFGGKRKISQLVWERLGNVNNYVEPFAGSLAVLLGRAEYGTIETVNDINGWITNFWRAVKANPDAVVSICDWPVNELDLNSRHSWMIDQFPDLTKKLRADPEYFNPELAGWWVWGQCAWIGDDWACERRNRKTQNMPSTHAKGLNSRPHLGRGSGINAVAMRDNLIKTFRRLSDRLRFTRVCCGDWSRVCNYSTLDFHGLTGVFFDPPYSVADRADCYQFDSRKIAKDVAAWCLANQNNPKLRIALCGYEGEHELPDWECIAWSAGGGYGNKAGNQNRHRERIWFSPGCNKVQQLDLFQQTA
jgi:site-specific DNA-adenine methylase